MIKALKQALNDQEPQSAHSQQTWMLAKDVLKRVETLGDLFAPVLTLKQKLPSFEAESLA